MPDTVIASVEVRLKQALGAQRRQAGGVEKGLPEVVLGALGRSLPGMDAAIKDTLGDVLQEQELDLCRRLWREPVWDLKIVAGRILHRN